ncbi:hypothetical protein DHEL01_v206823 [Diaporthe helianthi]|uniref:C2H2-type domain-containing protein n=1 Tax=Diaporthe helianthi TaxID=158607 RepID=A0A2P5HX13_DIAHE|nr:hypothetical protein DHEL01_v206823 [Diaporthe helianthi]
MEGRDGQSGSAADAIHVVAAGSSSGAAEGRTTAAKKQSPKRFGCSHEGCNKRFTRLEHMQRHALNHSGAGDYTCPRCSAHFRRPDLLDRHMNRHRQRDEEAGGPGFGTLDTRKRSWKAPDGSVVPKRPRPTEPESQGPWVGSEFDNSIQVVSPPVSDEGRYNPSSHPYKIVPEPDENLGRCIDALDGSAAVPPSSAGTLFPQAGFGWGDEPGISNPRTDPSLGNTQLEYHPIFQPDTASSFNMPYTTALDYNWLFNIEAATASGFGMTSARDSISEPALFNSPEAEEPHNTDMTPSQQAQNPTPESLNSASWQHWRVEKPDGNTRERADSSTDTRASPGPRDIRYPASQTRTTKQPNGTGGHGPRNDADIHPRQLQSIDRRNPSRHGIDPPSLQRQRSKNKAHATRERPLAMLQNSSPTPRIDQEVLNKLLEVIEAAEPKIPDTAPGSSVRDHPLLSLQSVQTWLDLFFTQFNTTYPLIHMPTFKAGTTEPLLLLSILLLGATYLDKATHQLAVCIHDVIRPSIFAHAGFSARPKLWTLQTILLVECFGKSRAGQKQHDMSHLFHGLLINLIRRSDCQSVAKTPAPQDGVSLAEAWELWAIAEQKKRLALLCFMWDTQHAVLFCQSLCMSAFELRCSLPCAQTIWEAPDAELWARSWPTPAHQASSSSSSSPDLVSPPMFLPALKSYLSGQPAGPNTPNLDALGQVLVLHGLMSIAWDMQRRDQTSLGVVSTTGPASWKDLLSHAYDRWKADFDYYCHEASLAPPAEPNDSSPASEWSAFAAAYRAVYHAAQALLHMDFLDIQIYAGARNILGRPVQQQDYVRSSRVVKRWASGSRERAATAAWHGAGMLRDLMAGGGGGSGSGGSGRPVMESPYLTSLFHVPWCLYLATLSCWAFHHAKSTRRGRLEDKDHFDGEDDDSDGSDEIVWDSNKEMHDLLAAMTGSVRDVVGCQGRRRTNGLVWVVADALSKVRWGIVHAGVVVLRGLVPMRLINQYEVM